MSKTGKIVLVFFAGMIPALLFITTVIYIVMTKDNGEPVAQILTSGISIIAIAVSVWVGLNIYNLVTKSEIQEEINKLYNAGTGFSKQIFLNELEKTSGVYCLSEYLLEQFKKRGALEPSPDITYQELSAIESEYALCCESYEKNQWDLAKTIAHRLIIRLKSDMFDVKAAYEKDPLLEIYMKSRMGDMYFYKNVVNLRLSGEKRNEEEMITLIKYFHDIMNKMRYSEDRYLAYLYNTIGYTRFLLSANSNQKLSGTKIPKAETCLKEAVRLMAKNGRYHRNLGLVHEKEYAAGELDTKELENEYDIARQQYKDAISNNPMDYKAYNNFAAIHLKKLDKKFKVEGRSKLICEMDFSLDKDDENTVRSEIDKDIEYLQMGLGMCVNFEDLHYNFGKALMYRYLLIESENSFLLEEAIRETKKVEIFNETNIGYRYVLRNIYEAKNEIEKAQSINEKLKGMGDSNNMANLYQQYLDNHKKSTDS